MELAYNEATTMECPDSCLENDVVNCGKVGFRLMELRYDKLDPFLKKHSIAELTELFDVNRIKPLTYNAVYIYQELFSEKDCPEKRGEVMHRMELAARLAPITGARDIIVVAPLHRDETAGAYEAEWDDVKKDCIRILNTLADFAEKYGLRLGFEPVGNCRCAVRTLDKAAEIVEAVGRPSVGYVLDAYNLFQYDKTNDFSAITKLKKEKIIAVHINNADDTPIDKTSQKDRRFCDSGVIDLNAYLSAICATGYDGMVSIETVRPEYYKLNSAAVIENAYRTTEQCVSDFLLTDDKI